MFIRVFINSVNTVIIDLYFVTFLYLPNLCIRAGEENHKPLGI